MIPQIQIGDIPPSNVVVGLLSLYKLVVFCDDVDGGRMGPYGAGSRNKSEDERVAAPVIVDEVVCDDDEDVVDDLVDSDRRVLHEYGSECVENLDYAVEEEFVPGVVD